MTFRCSQEKRKHQGQGLVEFALVFPLFLLLVYGIFEVARAIFMYSAVLNASRDAARYAAAADAVQVQDEGYFVYYTDCTGIKDRAKKVSAFVDLSAVGAVTVNYDSGPGTDLIAESCEALFTALNREADPLPPLVLGDRINVTVTATFNPVVPILNFAAIPISSTTTRTLVTGVNIWDPNN